MHGPERVSAVPVLLLYIPCCVLGVWFTTFQFPFALLKNYVLVLPVCMARQACAYIRDSGDSSKGKKRKAVGKDRRKVGKKLSQRGLGAGGPLEVRIGIEMIGTAVAAAAVFRCLRVYK